MLFRFDYISESGMKLSDSQKKFLAEIEQATCKLDEFSCLYDIRLMKRFKVIVSDSKSFRETLEKELDVYRHYNEEMSFRRSGSSRTGQRSLLDEYWPRIIQETIGNIGNILNRIDGLVQNHPLLGLYRSYDYSYDSPVIYLFKQNIDAYAERTGVSPDNVFGFVYIHEAMHAYYDSKNNQGFFPVTELEEAFAECGMIEFLNQTRSALPPQLANDARNFVLQKQLYGPYDYGFGLAMADISAGMGETGKIMTRYREISNWIGFAYHYPRDVRSLVRKSQPDSTYDKEANSCYELVKRILFETHVRQPEIDFNALPGLKGYMRKAGVTLKPGATSPVILPPLNIASVSKLYLPNSGPQTSVLVELFTSPHLNIIVYAIFKSQEGNSKIPELLNRLGVATKLEADKKLGTWISNTLVFPDGSRRNIQGGWSFDDSVSPTNVHTLLRAFQLWEDITFAILHTDGHYVLYGPDSLINVFEPKDRQTTSKPIKSTSSFSKANKDYTRYNLKDLQGNIHTGLTKAGLVFEGINSYALANPAMTDADLQNVFSKGLAGWGPRNRFEIVMPVDKIPKIDDTIDRPRYDKQIIHTASKDIRVNNQWKITNIQPVIDKFKELGMTIKEA